MHVSGLNSKRSVHYMERYVHLYGASMRTHTPYVRRVLRCTLRSGPLSRASSDRMPEVSILLSCVVRARAIVLGNPPCNKIGDKPWIPRDTALIKRFTRPFRRNGCRKCLMSRERHRWLCARLQIARPRITFIALCRHDVRTSQRIADRYNMGERDLFPLSLYTIPREKIFFAWDERIYWVPNFPRHSKIYVLDGCWIYFIF